ncbi:MAG: right-handed parallel beta-helix repeat-containing protein [Cyclobacteriaceae bacterium]
MRVKIKTPFYLSVYFWLFWHTAFCQNTYYVSADGNDQNTGLDAVNPWATIDKLNSFNDSFISGDQILFRKGDTFYGSLVFNLDGLTISSFGAGEKPVLSGGIVFNDGWSLIEGSSNIWERTLPDPPVELNNLYREGERLPLGRFPNHNEFEDGFLRLETSTGTSQFVDEDLDNSFDWTGADVVIRVFEYRYNRIRVASHSGNTVNLGAGFDVPSLHENSGYYFVNSISALDLEGEWSYDANTGKIYVYSATNPNNQTFTYPNEDVVIDFTESNDILIEGISIRYGNRINLDLVEGENVKVKNTEIIAAGGDGIRMFFAVNGEISGCSLEDINGRGLNIRHSSNMMILDNDFSKIGMDPAYGEEKSQYGIYNESNETQILRNTFDHIGGGAIVTGGMNQLIKNNYVNNALMCLEDMGGIYTNNNLGGLTTAGTIIEENIVTNCLGYLPGNYRERHWSIGIYLDNHSMDVTVRNNTVFNVSTSCYFFNLVTGTTTFEGNTGMNSLQSEVFFELYSQQNTQSSFVFNNNLFVSRDTSASHYVFNNNGSVRPFDDSGIYSGNYFLNPFRSEQIRVRYINGNSNNVEIYDAEEFDLKRPNASNSFPSPLNFKENQSFDDLQIVYNESLEPKVIDLPSGKFIDAKNSNSFCGSMELQPFESVILFKYSEEGCEIQDDPLGSLSGYIIENVLDIESTFKWDSTDNAINYDFRYKVMSESEWINVNNLFRTSITINSLNPDTNYAAQVRASGNGVEGQWSELEFKTLIEAPCEAPLNPEIDDLFATSATIQWSDFRIGQYVNVRYKNTSSAKWIELDSISDEVLYLTDLIPSSEYQWELQTLCQYGISEWEEQENFTTSNGVKREYLFSNSSNQWIIRNVETNEVSFNPHESVILVGRSGSDNCGVAVYPFQLPDLQDTAQITNVEYQILLDNVSPVGDLDAELWALPYRMTDEVLEDDYYDGEFDASDNSKNFLLQQNFISPESIDNVRQVLQTDAHGNSNLRSFFIDQYNKGAIGDEWIFVRVNPNKPTTVERHWLDRSDDVGDGVPTIILQYNVDGSFLPEPVSELSARLNQADLIELSWMDNSIVEEGFVIERVELGSKQGFIRLDTVNGNVTSYIDSNTSRESAYGYRVLSFSTNGFKGYSNYFEFLPANLPSRPSNLEAVSNDLGDVILVWEDNALNETGFIVERKETDLGFKIIDTLQANTEMFLDGELTSNQKYTYRLSAFNNLGSSEYSNEVEVQSVVLGLNSLYNLTLYPNPTKDNVIIKLPEIMNTAESIQIQLRDIEGRLIIDQRQLSNKEYISLQLPSENGIYIISVNIPSANVSVVRRVIKINLN